LYQDLDVRQNSVRDAPPGIRFNAWNAKTNPMSYKMVSVFIGAPQFITTNKLMEIAMYALNTASNARIKHFATYAKRASTGLKMVHVGHLKLHYRLTVI
jgi:hypothetical protein